VCERRRASDGKSGQDRGSVRQLRCSGQPGAEPVAEMCPDFANDHQGPHGAAWTSKALLYRCNSRPNMRPQLIRHAKTCKPSCHTGGVHISSAAAWGSEIRMSEGRAADKFANFPHDASSARNPEGARTSARLFFGYFLLAKQKNSTSAAGPRPGQTKLPEMKRTGAQRRLTPTLYPEGRGSGHVL
jgi:hypothetical protein